MKDIFICYSRKDRDFVDKLNKWLMSQNHSIWQDLLKIVGGDEWRKEIEEGIESSCIFLCVISSNSLESKYCKEEREYAIECGKKIVPIFWEPRGPSKDEKDELEALVKVKLEGSIEKLHRISFSDDKIAGGESGQLLKALERVDWQFEEERAQLIKRYLEWDRSGKLQDKLLAGSELDKAESWLERARIESDSSMLSKLGDFIESGIEYSKDLPQKANWKQMLGGAATLAASVLLASR